tara:strand:+ start:89 stop:436 length:348 start_codon:yes stop_codon:yes gene_type:complete
MKIKTLLKQNNAVEVVFIKGDNDNKHYQIKGKTKNIFYHHHLGRYQGAKRNPNWERVTIHVTKKLPKDADYDYIKKLTREEYTLGLYQFDGIGCVTQADKKLTELINHYNKEVTK